MPSLMRFLAIVGTIFGVAYGTLYVLAVHFEPELRDVSKPVLGVTIKQDDAEQ